MGDGWLAFCLWMLCLGCAIPAILLATTALSLIETDLPGAIVCAALMTAAALCALFTGAGAATITEEAHGGRR